MGDPVRAYDQGLDDKLRRSQRRPTVGSTFAAFAESPGYDAHLDRGRVCSASAALAIVSARDALAVLTQLDGRPLALSAVGKGPLALLLPDPAATLARLVDAGLVVVTDEPLPVVLLTKRGHEVWLAVRSLAR